MTNMTELERLVKVETKLDTLIDQQKSLIQKLDKVAENYVTRPEFDKAIDGVRKEANRKSVVRDVLVVIFTAIVTFLLMSFLNNLGK